jgi:hypothetical protein
MISRLLAAHKGAAVQLQIYASEKEALDFTNQIGEALRSAGLTVNGTSMFGQTGTGLGFVLHAQNDKPPIAIAIAEAFGAAGITYGVIVRPELVAEHGFILFIGSKPKLSN